VARRKITRKRPLKSKIAHACAQCGAAVAAGVLFCTGCVIAATPAQARPAPAPRPNVVELAPSRQVPHFVPFANLEGLAGLLGDRPEDSHPPEPTYTFNTPGIFAAGTAVTGQPAPRGRGGGRPWTLPA
jgi:hypothetical protein